VESDAPGADTDAAADVAAGEVELEHAATMAADTGNSPASHARRGTARTVINETIA
jgi:hypothetical protein